MSITANTDTAPTVYAIKEDGRNGTVRVERGRLVRIIRRVIGRNDQQTILIRRISSMHLDRRTLGADVLELHVGARVFTWKMPQAEQLHDLIVARQDDSDDQGAA